MKKCIPLVTALVLVACGGSESTTAAPAEPTTTTSAPAAAAGTTAPPPSTTVAIAPTSSAPATTAPPPTTTAPPTPFTLSSTAFDPGGPIPVEHSCFGDNASPALEWSGAPEGTATSALTVVDPDSDPPGFVHWVIFNLPGNSEGLPEGVPADETLPIGAVQGVNDFAPFAGSGGNPDLAPINGIGWDGPCPPAEHTYVFTLYALDARLELAPRSTLGELRTSMETHILATAELTGSFAPPG